MDREAYETALEILYGIKCRSIEKVGRILHSISPEELISPWLSWAALTDSAGFDSDALRTQWESFNGSPCPWGICDLMRLAGRDASQYALERLGDAEGYHPPLDLEQRHRALRWLSGALGLPLIEHWIQRGTEAGSEVYYLKLSGCEVEIMIGPAKNVLTKSLFEQSCYAQAGRRIEIGAKMWPRICDWLALVVEKQEIEEDTSLGRLKACLDDYLEDHQVQGRTRETIENRWPFLDAGMIHVHVGNLMRHLRETRQVLREPYKTLKAYGWSRVTISYEGSSRSYYRVPIDAVSVPQKVRN